MPYGKDMEECVDLEISHLKDKYPNKPHDKIVGMALAICRDKHGGSQEHSLEDVVKAKLAKKGHSDPTCGASIIENSLFGGKHEAFKDPEFKRLLIEDLNDLEEQAVEDEYSSLAGRAALKSAKLAAIGMIKASMNPNRAINTFLKIAGNMIETGTMWHDDFPMAADYLYRKYGVTPEEIGLD